MKLGLGARESRLGSRRSWEFGRLIVVGSGWRGWLPESRLARVVALFTAAVLPVRSARRNGDQRDA